jgi:hypothetical protein
MRRLHHRSRGCRSMTVSNAVAAVSSPMAISPGVCGHRFGERARDARDPAKELVRAQDHRWDTTLPQLQR